MRATLYSLGTFLRLHSILLYEHITICPLPADAHLGDFYFSNGKQYSRIPPAPAGSFSRAHAQEWNCWAQAMLFSVLPDIARFAPKVVVPTFTLTGRERAPDM